MKIFRTLMSLLTFHFVLGAFALVDDFGFILDIRLVIDHKSRTFSIQHFGKNHQRWFPNVFWLTLIIIIFWASLRDNYQKPIKIARLRDSLQFALSTIINETDIYGTLIYSAKLNQLWIIPNFTFLCLRTKSWLRHFSCQWFMK